ncbi:hypothetical protein [Sinorhizobium sp. CCBAU 05631]|uniref:hypothetical protein n=1 Tax=Sinorhizobium sp. CCBAU 05631 TaxID=794846 RepID=UPI0012FAD427|nr:hypothetical protein [Sinorhizobium sp. CCBAU 05631]
MKQPKQADVSHPNAQATEQTKLVAGCFEAAAGNLPDWQLMRGFPAKSQQSRRKSA